MDTTSVITVCKLFGLWVKLYFVESLLININSLALYV